MTGYGRAEAALKDGKVVIEIRTLNGKNADVNIKTNLLPKDKELEVRQLMAASLHRGTLDLFMGYEPNAGADAKCINAALVRDYCRQVVEIEAGLKRDGLLGGAPMVGDGILSAILRMPDVMDAGKQEVIDEAAWLSVEEAIRAAIAAVNDYRSKEGAALYRDVTARVRRILELEDTVEAFEGERIDAVKARLSKALEELGQKPDQGRFEQELVFYLEKLDINEEKVRLRQHCKYFLDTIDAEEFPGKKLGFIIQEMGREINTTGSKANHAGIQKAVVLMKDELEKIREQSMNIL